MDIAGYGLQIEIPDDWDGRIYRRSAEFAVTFEASTLQLAPIGDDAVQETEDAMMKSSDVYIRFDDIGPPPTLIERDQAWQLDSSSVAPVGQTDLLEEVQ